MTAPLLQLDAVEKRFATRGGSTTAANAVDLTIERGEIVGLVGESGSGKSTIANLVLGMLTPDAGEIRFDGRPLADWFRRGERAYRARVQAVFQQPLLALDRRRTVGWSVAEPMVIHRTHGAAARRIRVVELLRSVGLDEVHADRLPSQLSGGQLQRVNIARALALDPDLLVCDEAVSALDVSVQAQILDLFLEVQSRLGVAMLFISHNMAVVRHISDSMVVMHHGDVVEQGRTDDVCGAPRSDYAKALIGAWLEPRVVEA